MAEFKYRFDPKTLQYERIRESRWQRTKRALIVLTPGIVMGVLGMLAVYTAIDSPKEEALRRENEQLQQQYYLLGKQLDEVQDVLGDVRRRDDNIYRVIFEADPLPESFRQVGVGGTDRYKDLEGFASSSRVIGTKKRLDKLAKQLYVQSRSLDQVSEMALNKQDMLASIPSIQPVSNKDLTRVASGFGMRMHPIHKIEKFHEGMDFTAPTGAEINVTGDGKVTWAGYAMNGYGNHVIVDHGYGYETLYAHLNEIDVKKGQKLTRGDIIGRVGNTGLSAGPHLHYEVHKEGEAVDPASFYFNDLSVEEYTTLLELSRNANQSLD